MGLGQDGVILCILFLAPSYLRLVKFYGGGNGYFGGEGSGCYNKNCLKEGVVDFLFFVL